MLGLELYNSKSSMGGAKTGMPLLEIKLDNEQVEGTTECLVPKVHITWHKANNSKTNENDS